MLFGVFGFVFAFGVRFALVGALDLLRRMWGVVAPGGFVLIGCGFLVGLC